MDAVDCGRREHFGADVFDDCLLDSYRLDEIGTRSGVDKFQDIAVDCVLRFLDACGVFAAVGVG